MSHSRPSAQPPRSRGHVPLFFQKCLRSLLDDFLHWKIADLKKIATAHNVYLPYRASTDRCLGELLSHECSPSCNDIIYCFAPLLRKRTLRTTDNIDSVATNNSTSIDPTTQLTNNGDSSPTNNTTQRDDLTTSTVPHAYIPPDDDLKREIILEWQREMGTENQRNGVCACCSVRVRAVTLKCLNVNRIDFSLLCNDDIPDHLLPTSYSTNAYDRALLNPKGLSDTQRKTGTISLCKLCASDLTAKTPRMPRFALANWLYYAHDRLPEEVKMAFNSASVFEKLLIARARANRITLRYCENPSSVEYGHPHETSQRYNKGNVLVMPQDTLNLPSSLPPTLDEVRDSMCILMINHSKNVTPDNISTLKPSLVRKSRVAKLLNFLIANNPHYQVSDEFSGFSSNNLNALADESVGPDDDFVPPSVEIAHLDVTSGLGEIDVTADYTNRNDTDPNDDSIHNSDEILLENVGYTNGDTSPQNYHLMKLRALQHCLAGERYLESRTGSVAEKDFKNPRLLSWLFPHLDPWGIGGFHHEMRKRRISLEEQLSHLVSIDNSPFSADESFAFVYFNISQKKKLIEDCIFRVNERVYTTLTEQLMATPDDVIKRMEAKYQNNPTYYPDNDEEEKRLLRLLNQLQSINHKLPGSNGHKLRLRNEIRALIHRLGAPALWITINPSDVNNPLVRLIFGEDIKLEDLERGEDLKKFQRQVLAAKNPHVAAIYFDRVIKAFIEIILRHGRDKAGLFGRCTGYYGTVEAQGKGTLHCHFLVWLDGHLSPQVLREKMMSDDDFKRQLFAYLEGIIKTELPGTTEPTYEQPGQVLQAPTRPRGVGNPAALALPQCKDLTPEEFQRKYEDTVTGLVIENHWHRHNKTCWKHLRRGDPRDDAHCRMRIDGSTHPVTELDPETHSILLRRLHPRINSHNDIISFLTQSNNDVKFIGSGQAAKALVYYVTDYITKPPLPTHIGLSALRVAIEKNQRQMEFDPLLTPQSNARSLFIKCANGMLGRQETSHAQVMSYLVGGGDHYTSHRFTTLYWAACERKVLKEFSEVRSQSILIDLYLTYHAGRDHSE